MRYLVWLAFLVAGGVMLYADSDLPRMGDSTSPPATYVSPRYIEKSYEETGTPNFVTAVLADYRSYDTLGETAVIVTAGLACVLILGVEIQRRG
jgi:multicomponent Na+:H+ antiporter subunit B